MNLNSIIAKYILGKESKEELLQLQNWEQESNDNLEALRNMKNIWLDAELLKGYEEYNVEQALSKMGIDEREKKSNVFSLVLRYAAIVGLVLCAYFGIQYFSEASDTDGLYLAENVDAEFILEDGSKATLSKASTLSLIKDAKGRSYKLEGSGFFDVEHMDNAEFSIKTNMGLLTVLGTQFSVVKTNQGEEVYVKEGSVRYEANGRSIILGKGDFIAIDKKDIVSRDNISSNYLSWVDKKLVFDNKTLKSVVKDLNQYFGQEKLKFGPDVKNMSCRVNSTYDNTDLETIMEDLGILLSLQFHKEGDTIVIDSVGC